VWPEELLPIRYIGELELNKNVDEYFPQTEQVAFCTAHVVPGIGFSDDPLLQGRNFSYFDTQLSRLGINWQQLPINRPVCPVMNHHRDGQGQHTITPGRFNYWPNRESMAPPAPPNQAYLEYPEKIVAMKQRLHSKKFGEHFAQAQVFWNSMTPIEQSHIVDALCFELAKCDDPIVFERMVTRLTDIALPLAQAVAVKVGVETPTKEGRHNPGLKMKGLSMTEFTPEAQGLPPTIASRMIAIIVDDGCNVTEVEAVKAALMSAGALPFIIAPKKQAIKGNGGSGSVKPDQHLEAARSTMFDALYIPGGSHVETLSKSGRAIHWIRESFGHCKAIGATGEAVALVKQACGIEGMTFASGAEVVDSYGVVTAGGVGKPGSFKEGLKMLKDAKSFTEAYAYNISQHRNFDRELDGLTSMVAY